MSSDNRQFSLALESYLELRAGELPPRTVPLPAQPSLETILAEIGPLPREALFLGVAFDGLPVLLNLHDPAPGPLLIPAEAGSGKTDFLKSVARGLVQTHKASELQYGVLTNHPEEWKQVEPTPHRVGIFPIGHSSSQDFVLSLASWAHANKSSKQSVLLLVDDLEALARLDFDALQNFRWLLARGPARRVWPIITMNADRYGQVLAWIPLFRTRIFGRIRNGRAAEVLSSDKESALDGLEAPVQFSLRENEKWVKFRLPGF